MRASYDRRVSDSLLERARTLLEENTETAEHDGRHFVFTVPSRKQYPFQWFWDSCFHAIVWARVDVERAQEELRGLLAAQTDSGFIPHVIFWDRSRVSRFGWHYLESAGLFNWFFPGRAPRTTAMIQPPVIAQAVEAIAVAGGDSFVREALPTLERYYRHLVFVRDPDRDGLISIIAQFESGLDFSPAYDPPRGRTVPHPLLVSARGRLPEVLNKLLGYDVQRILRVNPHQFEDVLVNSIHCDGLQALARLAERAGAAELATWASSQAQVVLDALLERCYDERRGLFFNLVGRRDRRTSRVKTVVSLLPLLLTDLPAEVAARLVEHLTDPREFWPAFPVPSVALDEPVFTTDSRPSGQRLIWRGPCSLNTNWLLVRGLRRHGFGEVAEQLAERSRTLVDRGGFNEFFNPLDGTPVGAERFGWATLAADL
jgi:hypothetical protein